MIKHPSMHMPTLLWLYDPQRRKSGRTHALALAAAITTTRHPNRRIPIFDHHPHADSRMNACRLAETVLKINSINYGKTGTMISSDGMRKIDDHETDGVINKKAFRSMIEMMMESGISESELHEMVNNVAVEVILSS